MYSTCIFCHSPLGANEAIENFPVGRRLAFDAAKGRLWAVCRKCERWNLTPLEERWEAIEECEKGFRETRLRVSTGEIGLARLGEGTELVRIGKPLRPEFAAWRYGDQFGKRRRNATIQTGIFIVAGASIPFLGPVVGLSLGGLGGYGWQILRTGRDAYDRLKVVTHVRDERGRPLAVRAHDVSETVLLPPRPGDEWGLSITHRALAGEGKWWQLRQNAAVTDLRGETALRAAAKILPHVNRRGAKASEVQAAVTFATQRDDPMKSFEEAAKFTKRGWYRREEKASLNLLPVEMRLALEMASHEDAERRAMQGELKQLEDAWREAEEIANISDNLFLPEAISERLGKLKNRSTSSPE